MLGLGGGLTSLGHMEDGVWVSSNSWDFDGTNDHVNIGDGALAKPTTTDTSEGVGFTVAFWCKSDAWGEGVGDYPSAAEHAIGTIATGGWGISAGTRLSATLAIVDGGGYQYLTLNSDYKPFHNGAALYRSSMWHHITLTFDGRYLKVYTDGTLRTTVDAGEDDNTMYYGSGTAAVDVLIGADATSKVGGVTGSQAHWAGLIDDVGIWNTALDLEAIDEIYEAVNTSGAVMDLTLDSGDYDYSGNLTGLWRANEGSGTTATDDAGSNNGTLVNGTAYSAEVPS